MQVHVTAIEIISSSTPLKEWSDYERYKQRISDSQDKFEDWVDRVTDL